MKDLIEAIKKLAYTGHYTCEDSWYSCPLSEDGCANDAAGDECNCWAQSNKEMEALFNQLEAKIKELESSLRWIPVTEQLPPHDTYVDFLGADGGGHGSRGLSKEDCEKYSLTYNPIPKIYENETGPYILGKDQQGYWGVTHWRLRPGQQPDFDKFIKENT